MPGLAHAFPLNFSTDPCRIINEKLTRGHPSPPKGFSVLDAFELPGGDRIREFFRLRPLHLDQPEARARERHRRVALTASFAVVARIVAAGTSIVTIPITLSYLGSERFGLWMAISSILTVLSFADFGIGNGVMNAVADAHGRNDTGAIKAAISSGAAILSSVAAALILIFLAIYSTIDWGHLFNVHGQVARAEAGPALLAFISCFAMNILVGLVQRTQMGLQEGFRSYIWQLIGQIGGLLGILAVVRLHGGLPLLVLALTGCPVLAALVNGTLFFGITHRELLPSRHCISRSAARRVCHLGVLFFVLQVVCALAFFSDNFIIIRILGAEAVTQYAVPQRMFMMISVVLAMSTAPLWPAYAEAISRGDSNWVRRTLLRSLKLVFGVALLGVLLLVFGGREILHLWVGSKIPPPSIYLLAGLGIWTLFDVTGNALAMFLNGASIIRYQVVVSLIFGVASLAGKIWAVHKYGTTGLPWATIVIYFLSVAIPAVIVIPRILNRIDRRFHSGDAV
jgi:O-antigen/teichoic acid export membrane protein